VPRLLEVADYIAQFTGFHDFAEFTAEARRAVLSHTPSWRLCMVHDMSSALRGA